MSEPAEDRKEDIDPDDMDEGISLGLSEHSDQMTKLEHLLE